MRPGQGAHCGAQTAGILPTAYAPRRVIVRRDIVAIPRLCDVPATRGIEFCLAGAGNEGRWLVVLAVSGYRSPFSEASRVRVARRSQPPTVESSSRTAQPGVARCGAGAERGAARFVSSGLLRSDPVGSVVAGEVDQFAPPGDRTRRGGNSAPDLMIPGGEHTFEGIPILLVAARATDVRIETPAAFAPLSQQRCPVGVSGGDQQVPGDLNRVFLIGGERLPEPVSRNRSGLHRPHPVLLDAAPATDMRVTENIDIHSRRSHIPQHPRPKT